MKTAIVTGASSGLGREFVRHLPAVFPEMECVWLIARREDRLEEISRTLRESLNVRIFPLDLCDPMSFTAYQEELVEEQPEVMLLVNNAGCGFLGNVGEGNVSVQTRMTDLNVRALTAVTHLTIPYMAAGGRILNVSSIASFCPTPRMSVYSATKSYVSAFTAGVREELRGRGVTATAVCPGPMETEFLAVGGADRSRKFTSLPVCEQSQAALGALRAARAGQGVYTPRLVYKGYRLLAKVLPRSLLVRLTGL